MRLNILCEQSVSPQSLFQDIFVLLAQVLFHQIWGIPKNLCVSAYSLLVHSHKDRSFSRSNMSTKTILLFLCLWVGFLVGWFIGLLVNQFMVGSGFQRQGLMETEIFPNSCHYPRFHHSFMSLTHLSVSSACVLTLSSEECTSGCQSDYHRLDADQ